MSEYRICERVRRNGSTEYNIEWRSSNKAPWMPDFAANYKTLQEARKVIEDRRAYDVVKINYYT